MSHKRGIVSILAGLLLVGVIAMGVWYIVANSGYTVTQYADTDGLQAMFYTIESGRGELIVIDGGHTENAEYVKQIIAEKGGHVDAWILTHPHPDHIGAFNVLWNELEGNIDCVYTPEISYEAYLAKAEEWDEIEYYQQQLDYMSESDKFVYLHRGDEFSLAGMQVKVLSAYNDYVNAISRDLANDGSLMLKFSAKEESMLFCSDIGIGMSDSILLDYGEEIASDYLQMGHHGYGGLSEDFYRKVSPKAAFFDAPEWLMHPAEGANYSTPEKEALMEQLGAKVFYYATAPNTIKMK